MDPVKHLGRSKWFACFTPVADDDAPCSRSPTSRKTAHHGFSGSLKSVLLRTPLVRKFRSKRYRRDSCRSGSNPSPKTKKQTSPTHKKSFYKGFSDDNEESFDRQSLFSSTPPSSASSVTSDSSSGSERINGPASLDSRPTRTDNRHTKRADSKCSYNIAAGMFVLLVCLVALVFWGKFFAIVICILTWLFSAPSCGSQDGGWPVNGKVVDSEEYKKRVIMEGFLQRNRPFLRARERLRGHLLNWPRIRNIARVPGDEIDDQLKSLLPNSGDGAEADDESLVALNRTIYGKAEGDREPLNAILYRDELARTFSSRGDVMNPKLSIDIRHCLQVLEALLPKGMIIPSTFEAVEHIAHLNLRDEHLQYKNLVVKAKDTNSCKQVEAIHNEYRTMQLEILAGNKSVVTTLVENGWSFHVDLAAVYWNSRYATERQRLLSCFSDVVCDIFAGVGPIAISAAKKVKRVYVYANGLNPCAVECLERNCVLNKIEMLLGEIFKEIVQAKNMFCLGFMFMDSQRLKIRNLTFTCELELHCRACS
ncbi:tRNA (guanine(37)-N1)-methyltransferase 1 [Sesamum angolense]|uniref:tRNA (Guanine(37)-N1)-methyltransferase 1 n=1 Tax=Sesamum angolense TaxID=2727404 RepID=A0AAE1WSA1_9LAMI|nr:tRNA (guanine(37)-N1)-methyltransferase 1 [Sesamum angolense]